LAVAVLAIAASAPGRAAADTEPPRLSLTCSGTPRVFQLTIANMGTEPTAAVIGVVLGNDRRYVIDAELRLTVRRPGVRDRDLEYLDPMRPPAVAGRVDPWLVALPPGAAFSVQLAARFGDATTREVEPLPDDVELRVTLPTRDVGRLSTGLEALQFVHRWVGTLVSNWIQYPQACH
jgi:hypothetical protein